MTCYLSVVKKKECTQSKNISGLQSKAETTPIVWSDSCETPATFMVIKLSDPPFTDLSSITGGTCKQSVSKRYKNSICIKLYDSVI